jgi:O-antigen/teichoic acid export membrane protein
VLGGAAIAAYPYICDLALNQEYRQGWLAFAILMAGIIANSGLIPFGNILTQAGKPGTETMVIIFAVLFNIVVGVAAIPFLGMEGAALATAVTFLLNSLLVAVISGKILKQGIMLP